MGFNELSVIDGPCDDGPCAALPACAGAYVTCITDDDIEVSAPASLTIEPTFHVCEAFESGDPDYDPISNGDYIYQIAQKNEFDCWEFVDGDPIDLGDYTFVADNEPITTLQQPLALEFVSSSSSDKCCVFNYETPILNPIPVRTHISPPHGPDPITQSISEWNDVFTNRLQYLGSHPYGTTDFPSQTQCYGGFTGPCDEVTISPPGTEGYADRWAHAKARMQICRDDCDLWWVGSFKLEWVYWEFYETTYWTESETPGGPPENVQQIYTSSIAFAPLQGPTYDNWEKKFYILNTGEKTNASGDFELTDPREWTFSLRFKGTDNPCPLGEDGPITGGGPNPYVWGFGNLGLVQVRVGDTSATGGTGTNESEADTPVFVDDAGFEGYVIPVKYPIVDGVTTLDDILDVIDDSDYYEVTARSGSTQTLPAGAGNLPPFGDGYMILGLGTLAGGSSGVKPTGSDLAGAILDELSGEHYVVAPDPEIPISGELFTPFLFNNIPPGSGVGVYVFLRQTGCESDEETCDTEGGGFSWGCWNTQDNSVPFPVTSHQVCQYGTTWTVS